MLKRVSLNVVQKDLLEKLINTEIHLRNTFAVNQQEIGDLLEQGKQNALIYLQRNQLGQRLSIFEENNLFKAVVEIKEKLVLHKIPRRIECYDISHLSGKFVYGSMVTFIDGVASKKNYRLFKTKEQNNDFENHQEVLRRRLQRALDWELESKLSQKPEISSSIGNSDLNLISSAVGDKKNSWQLPDLIIVDGGKGQLSADLQISRNFQAKFRENNLEFEVEMVGLAKQEEEVFLPQHLDSLVEIRDILPKETSFGSEGGVLLAGQAKFLIQRIRDEAHRFAITNNRNARLKTASKSELDNIKGIGQKTKEKLLTTFGSTQNLVDYLYKNPELVYELVGKSIIEKLKKHFGV